MEVSIKVVCLMLLGSSHPYPGLVDIIKIDVKMMMMMVKMMCTWENVQKCLKIPVQKSWKIFCIIMYSLFLTQIIGHTNKMQKKINLPLSYYIDCCVAFFINELHSELSIYINIHTTS